MWNRLETADRGLDKRKCAFNRTLAMAAVMTAFILGTATYALAASDRDNNPPGPRGGPGTNWENPPGPRGGPGASPDAKRWRPWVWRRIYNGRNPTPKLRPWTQRRIYNARNPTPKLRPWTQRRIYNARNPQRPVRVRPNPRRRLGSIRRR